VLFHPQQYAIDDFPFDPLTCQTRCRWVCFRDVSSGGPQWFGRNLLISFRARVAVIVFVPQLRQDRRRNGRSACCAASVQEVIERDALLGAWWGAYPVDEFPQEAAWGARNPFRLQRPNLRWRFFRIQSPFSHHVTMVTVEGEDREGFCHSIGSACASRASRVGTKLPWKPCKAAITSAICDSSVSQKFCDRRWKPFPTRRLLQLSSGRIGANRPLSSPPRLGWSHTRDESLIVLCERLRGSSPVLVRTLTPSMLVGKGLDWRVAKVIVPGLQPLHGDDRFAHLGGPLWLPRGLPEWNKYRRIRFP